MKFKQITSAIAFLFITAFLLSSCSHIRYSYYTKHKVPYPPPPDAKFAKAIPAKPFITQVESALKEKPVSPKNNTVKNTATEKSADNPKLNKPAQEKLPNEFDIAKYFEEHRKEIIAGDNVNIDNRTLLIVLLVVLILILLSFIPGALWLLWVALLVLLIILLIKYLGLFS
ncbi:MAG: hypothetical protein JJE25_01085 [Bacteroidia bacterium]|nr:hypothetical protein [Bacteroidia bacterium]